MQNIKNISKYFLLILALSGCTKTTMMRTQKDYHHTLLKPSNMVVLPPLVEVNTIDASGKAARQYNYEYQLEDQITEVLIDKLRSKGYAIRSVSKKEIHDQKISRKVLAFQEEYLENINALYTPLLWDEKKALVIDKHLKHDLTELKNSTNADLVLFIEYAGRNKTAGANSKDVALSVIGSLTGVGASQSIEDSAEFISLRVAILDTANYGILWSNVGREGYSTLSSTFTSKANLAKLDKKRIGEILDVMFKGLPSRH